jgi:inorganic pyrophosphatase
LIHPIRDINYNPPRVPTDHFPVVIEVPRGGVIKYEVDEESGMLKLDRVLSSAVHYPANYGFVPRTLYLDGDPTDALVLSQHPFHPFCIVDVRAIGVLTMIDEQQQDDKLITVAIGDPAYSEFTSIDQLSKHYQRTIEQFFMDYKKLEKKIVTTHGFEGPDIAFERLTSSIVRYNQRWD